MKKLKLSALIVLTLGGLAVLAQAVKQDLNSSIGNGKAMEQNLNVPNATSPARNNNQHYEKVVDSESQLIKTDHPEASLSNSYNRSSYSPEETNQETSK